ncbi:MAG: nucleotidyl transferase AbiEii/AbiGii toxin family protein [Clostridium sp.]|nr:nucleotidyl transferase AbiEii/AbiGii toxin family protein [Clostridium sp.]
MRYRFSEDVDVAIVDASNFSGNQLKMFIKRLSKSMSAGMKEIITEGVTSKGSRYYKVIYGYESNPAFSAMASLGIEPMKIGQLMIEINSFANPYPYVSRRIESFISSFLGDIGRDDLIRQYGLSPFNLNVLDKNRTLTEKLVSVIRFSLSDNYQFDLPSKIRHFYDLHYLFLEEECKIYLHSESFKKDFADLLNHDRVEFDKPYGWRGKNIENSMLLSDFVEIWNSLLAPAYVRELPNIAYKKVPRPELIAESISEIFSCIIHQN